MKLLLEERDVTSRLRKQSDWVQGSRLEADRILDFRFSIVDSSNARHASQSQIQNLKSKISGPRTLNPEPRRVVQQVDRFGTDWAGRRVLVVGLGKSGSAACRLLQQLGCRVRVSELRAGAELEELAGRLRISGVERVDLGHRDPRVIDGCDAVVVSPGVPESAPPLQWAMERGLPVLNEVELAYRFCRAKIVAVTGTNGKSTTVTLIHRALQAARRTAVACGNLGTPCSDVLPGLSDEAIAAVEVSSFQLLSCDRFRPDVAVLLNIGTNHLDRHPHRDAYVAAKARLFQRQTPRDYAVLNARDPEVARLAAQLAAKVVWFGQAGGRGRFRIDDKTIRALPETAQAALQVCRIFGIPDPLTYQAIREFRGLEHRMEYVAMVRGVKIINDSKSTTPDSFLYALAHCAGPVVPIVGGRNKGLDFQPLGAALRDERVRGVVLIGEARRWIRKAIEDRCEEPGVRCEIESAPVKKLSSHLTPLTSHLSGLRPTSGALSPVVREADTLEAALAQAMSLAQVGDTVLFSPACASFDMFRNFEERGRIFKSLVNRLVEGERCEASGTNGR
ncbi:MAG: UDP-N-acetylmuramoyl-L-alanine--D-glutamate ligase [Candidatus Omnitrophica bacterium]|nr:UDP-N-acetylmuramoyl-L-alanine--D-glutamate ligase [Candidatus Omnitrophota bacterium]